MMKTTILMLLAVLISMVAVKKLNAQSSYVVIVNKSNAATALTKKEASDLFLKKTKWKDGSAATPVDLVSNSKIREQFTLEIHGKSISAIRSFWQQAAFSGTASAPPEKANEMEVIEFVKKNSGAIGYVSASAPLSDVKVLTLN
jgi:ABC-type phosphate transport system substrate-binding protein